MPRLENFLNDTPLVLLAVGLWLSLMLAREAGSLAFRLIPQSRRGDRSGDDEAYLIAAALGLLALMVGFTFSMALNRYDERRELVVAEANAIGTAYRHADLVGEPARSETRQMLQRYADTRLELYEAHDERERVDHSRSAAEAGRQQLWSKAVALDAEGASPNADALRSSLDAIFDTAMSLKAARESRVPAAVLMTLIIYVTSTAFVLGYALARHGDPHRLVSAMLFALITLAIAITFDLDRQGTGLIQIAPKPLADARAAMR